MYMNLVEDNFPKLYEEIGAQIDNILAGDVLKMDVAEQLDIPAEELNPTIQLKIHKENEATVIEGRFSVDYETKGFLEVPAETMVTLNRLFRMMYIPEEAEVRADLVEETSNCYFVLYYREIMKVDLEKDKDSILRKLYDITNFILLAMVNAKL